MVKADAVHPILDILHSIFHHVEHNQENTMPGNEKLMRHSIQMLINASQLCFVNPSYFFIPDQRNPSIVVWYRHLSSLLQCQFHQFDKYEEQHQ
jgi:hypothetical protein